MTDRPRPQGPHVKRLITRIMARMAVPAGGGLADGIEFFKSSERIKEVAQAATKEAFEHIDLLQSHPDWDGGDDEATAKAIVEEIEKRKLA